MGNGLLLFRTFAGPLGVGRLPSESLFHTLVRLCVKTWRLGLTLQANGGRGVVGSGVGSLTWRVCKFIVSGGGWCLIRDVPTGPSGSRCRRKTVRLR